MNIAKGAHQPDNPKTQTSAKKGALRANLAARAQKATPYVSNKMATPSSDAGDDGSGPPQSEGVAAACGPYDDAAHGSMADSRPRRDEMVNPNGDSGLAGPC